jgi:hypothetical protein
MDWKFCYIIEKLLERRCLKWARMTHLDISNTSYVQKKKPLKVGNRPDFLGCKWRATYCWKVVDEGYNFTLDLISIIGLHTKLWGPKVARVPTLGISRLPFESFRIKCHLDVGLIERHIIYYKGENGDFPQVRAMVSLVSSSLLVARLSLKSASTMH